MRILLASGSSGGHIFPALALMERLKDSGVDALMVLPKKDNGVRVSAEFGRIKYIRASTLDLKFSAKNIKAVYPFLIGAWQGFKVMVEFKPDVVIGFGSLNTLALLFWAWLFRIKTIIHEQNVIPGRANRLLAKFVDRIAISFPQTSEYLAVSAEKIVLTGNPLRKELVKLDRQQALDFFNFRKDKFNILVTGGSQGSHKLNTLCSKAFSDLPDRDNLQLVHISGLQDRVMLDEVYTRAGLRHKVFDFFTDMQYAYSAADLVICRAGATTIAELQRFGLPALLVPYPFAYAHQAANAGVLRAHGSALVIRDEELSVEWIKGIIQGFLDDPLKLKTMRQAYGGFQVLDTAGLLAGEVLNLN